jgi:L-lactate dehydrogenase complex protein LldF
MTGEEIHLNEALEKAGLTVVESDFGEYIVQLRHEAPYHFVFPAMHLVRGEINELFQEKLGSKPTDEPEELMMIARQVLRGKYITADVGISGANFAIAETGMISITENEKCRLTCTRPRCISRYGNRESPSEARGSCFFHRCHRRRGQTLTGYSQFSDAHASQANPADRRFHVVLLDNKRTHLADSSAMPIASAGACQRFLPQCRRPQLRTTYQADWFVITPHLRGLQSGSISPMPRLFAAPAPRHAP